MPAQASMTAMDTQSTRDARGAGPGGNAVGLPGATLAHTQLAEANHPNPSHHPNNAIPIPHKSPAHPA